ncbi:MAG TPA: DNA gyrase modulator, partial [Wenzhouxiangella sp.]|nr:DNA gyrase modulator [Wenzhouxiangella sp.]
MSTRIAPTGGAGIIHEPDREAEQLTEIAQQVLEQARAGGARQAEVVLDSTLGREAGVRLGDVETLEEARDRSIDVTVYIDQCTGSASTGDLRPQAVRETVERA